MNRGTLRCGRDQLAGAEKDLRHAINLQPKEYQAYVNLARCYENEGKLEEALKLYDQAIALGKNLPVLHRLRARLHQRRQDNKAALADLDSAIALENRARDHVERASLLRQAGKYEETIKSCRLAIQVSPAYAPAYRLLGETLVELRRPDEAILHLSLYVETNRRQGDKVGPGMAPVYRARGQALVELRKDEEALADYFRALDLEPDAATYVARGWLYILVEAPQLALRDFEKAIEKDPNFGDAYNGRGYIRVLRGDYLKGVADVEEALVRGPKGTHLLYNPVRIYALAVAGVNKDSSLSPKQAQDRQKQYEQRAVQLLRELLEKMPADLRVSYWQNVIVRDAALRPLHRSRTFLELTREYSEPKK